MFIKEAFNYIVDNRQLCETVHASFPERLPQRVNVEGRQTANKCEYSISKNSVDWQPLVLSVFRAILYVVAQMQIYHVQLSMDSGTVKYI
jgi:hypothetical protein